EKKTRNLVSVQLKGKIPTYKHEKVNQRKRFLPLPVDGGTKRQKYSPKIKVVFKRNLNRDTVTFSVSH
ncbi:hypothetical protein C0J52_18701, partial [Blattella germanica]